MTDKEKAIVMAHTGKCMLTGDKFQIFHKYVEDIMGRPIMTHEIGLLADTIKEKSRADFIALCADKEDWHDVPSYEMTLEQAQQAVRDLRKILAEYLEQEPCEDAISRQAVDEYITNLLSGYLYDEERTRLEDLLAFVWELPSVTPQPKTGSWIPVSERLPEEGEDVLTQAVFKDDVKLCVSSRVDYNYWTGWGTRDINIIAWMPLPQLYKAESEDKE